jgi:hypothetical protein
MSCRVPARRRAEGVSAPRCRGWPQEHQWPGVVGRARPRTGSICGGGLRVQQSTAQSRPPFVVGSHGLLAADETLGGGPLCPRLLRWVRSPDYAARGFLLYSYAPAHPGYPNTRVAPCLPQSNRRRPAPGAISAAVPNTRCGIAPSRRTSRPGWRLLPGRMTPHRRPTSSKPFAAISNVASSVVMWCTT